MISRVNTSWVIPVERPLVGWLAPKLPVGVMPDHLTLMGFRSITVHAFRYCLSWVSRILYGFFL